MFYVDSQRTVTRRDSSLVLPRRYLQVEEDEALSTTRVSTVCLGSESAATLVLRPWGSVQKEVVTSLFESMLDNIVVSWEVIAQQKIEDTHKNNSEATFASKKKKTTAKSTKGRKSRSKIDLDGSQQIETDPLFQSWWSSPDEKAVVRFKNGNVYEGNISMKCMHGEGRMQWTDGTVYLGNFNDNEIRGRGLIQWKDDTWYEGYFVGNLRHGKGLYVDSRNQRSYAGDWHCGTKHGQGMLFYSPQNSYDGDWIHNVCHGFGSREYCAMSGYRGEWDRYIRSGSGMMIWPNHDLYKGDWRNGVMHGYGIYVWDAYYNNSMSLPSLNAYRGYWDKGLRNGYGILNLGLGLGSHYKGYFTNNQKDGPGKFVTNNGLILNDKHLFYGDILGPVDPNQQQKEDDNSFIIDGERKLLPAVLEPFQFSICDNTVGLGYHIDVAIENLDKQEETRAVMINEFIENNIDYDPSIFIPAHKEEVHSIGLNDTSMYIKDLKEFEEISLRKSLKCFEIYLKKIYYRYATICNIEDISFTPVLIRLYMWQFYYDIDIQHKGLTLVEIDQIFHENREWLAKEPHNPFEKIYFWQFLHCLVSVANVLYASKHLPGPKPDSIVAKAFRTFMEQDVLPGHGRRFGRLTNGYAAFVPLKPLYELYRSIGEPHTVRQFLRAVHRPPHVLGHPQPDLVEASDDCLPLGRNVYIFGDEVTFITDEKIYFRQNKNCKNEKLSKDEETGDLQLFNLGNISTRAIIDIFTHLLPQVSEGSVVMNLDVEITFYEFFEAILACSAESNRVKDEEMRWRERFSLSSEPSRTVRKNLSKVKSPKIKV